MIINGFMYVTGFDRITSSFMVGIIGFFVFAMVFLAIADAMDRHDKRKKPNRHGLQGVPPADQYVVPDAGFSECGSKNCELRGCAIIGECQMARSLRAARSDYA